MEPARLGRLREHHAPRRARGGRRARGIGLRADRGRCRAGRVPVCRRTRGNPEPVHRADRPCRPARAVGDGRVAATGRGRNADADGGPGCPHA
ncbi:hypothetical protein G6F22_021285 [Rhizopus arrhizus]|nr:hypothetical protein G6F22_021285 [Rhizopus arrhizus]KAG0921140.1 hypothetical protein G6F31_020445 [Rhizopus arrhizus]KAG1386704.1 hypothetical protein G6F59_016734 [Rhizopus arrhizus]